MAEDAGLQLQRAIRARLIADTGLQGMFSGSVNFRDHPRERERFPYIEYRATQNEEWDTDAYDGSEGYGEIHTFSINLWSDYEGTFVVRRILRRCREILHDTTDLVLTDHNLVGLRWQFTDVFKEPDGQTYHGISQFRAVTEET